MRRPARGVGVLCLAYGAYGYFWGCWAVLFADFLRAHDLSPGAGSVRLAVLSITAIVAMTLLSPRLQRASRRALIALALSLQGGGALLIAVFDTNLQWLAFGIAGVGTGLVDVFVNAAGQTLESRTVTPVLQTVHASYGVGAAVGALATGAALTLGISFEAVLVGTTVVQVGAGLTCLRAVSLPPADAGSDDAAAASSLTAFIRWPYLVVPAVIVLGAFFIEGSMDVWSVIYLRQTLGASDILGSSGFAAFALATSVGRLFAARILFGMGYRRTILLSGLASSLAGLIALTATRPSVASVGFLLLGFSVAAAAPAAFGLAGGTGRDASLAVAAMTTVGYAGFVLGPPILGWLADEFGLRATMGALLACTLLIAVGGLLSRRAGAGDLVSPEGRAAEPVERPSRG